MTSLPPNVDAMIWKLAESDDVAAHADFVAQYPELKDELSRRVSLVNRLRSYPHVQSRLPRFNPSPEPTVATPKWVWPVAALVVLGGLSFAVSAGVTYFRSTQSPESVPVSPTGGSSQVPVPGASHPRSNANPPVNSSISTSTQAVEGGTRWDTPITLDAKNATLSAVVLAVASGAHVTIKVSPGVPNPTIDLSVVKQRAGSVLEALGKKYGFGVLYETDKYAVLIPVPPENPAPTTGRKPTGVDSTSRPSDTPLLPAVPNGQQK